jgi:hypothetical protein
MWVLKGKQPEGQILGNNQKLPGRLDRRARDT